MIFQYLYNIIIETYYIDDFYGGKMKKIGIYIHIPFCKQKCYYCDFTSFPNMEEMQEAYIQALKKEIEKFFTNNPDIRNRNNIYRWRNTFIH